jgi:acyl-CoA thioester hydrolase
MFPIGLDIPVAWGDMDSFGHVNNTVFFRWCESARIAYFDASGINERMQREKVGPILARASVDFRKPVAYPDLIRAEATVNRLGKTSFVMAYRLSSRAQGGVVGEGDSVIVLLDYRTGQKVELDAGLRQRIESLEGR